MMKKQFSFSASALALVLLVSCSAPQERIADLVQDGEYQKAEKWLISKLEDAPEDQLLNALYAEVLVEKCSAEACFDNNPADLQPLAKALENVPSDTIQTEDGYFPAYERFLAITNKTMQGENHPKAIISVLHFMPEGTLKINTISQMSARISEHLFKGEIPAADALLNSIFHQETKNTVLSQYANMLAGFITNDLERAAEAQSKLQQESPDAVLPESIIEATPLVVFQGLVESDANNGTTNFIEDFRTIIDEFKIAQLNTPEARRILANVIYGLSRNEVFIQNAIPHYALTNNIVKISNETEAETSEVIIDVHMPEDTKNAEIAISPIGDSAPKIIETSEAIPDNLIPTPEEKMATNETTALKSERLALDLLRLAVLVQPENKRAWQLFLKPVANYVSRTGDTDVMFKGIKPTDIPVNVISIYNAELFELIENHIARNKSILPFFQRIVLPVEGSEAVKDQARQMLNKAMIEAVEQANYELIYEYAAYQPDVARLSRQKVVSITIDALEKKWQENEFEGMEELSDFLTETLAIDFSLNSLLLQSFDDSLSKRGVQKLLSADTPEVLLKSPEDARVDLGDKFDYLKKRFSAQPDLLDNMLKSLVVKSEGRYGIPTALYSLQGYFSDDFPAEERKSYLVNALKNSIIQNPTKDLIEFVEESFSVQQKHNELPLSFVVSETIKRLKTLEDSRLVWEKSPTAFISALKNSRPQFATLMRAVEAYDNADHETAASLFTILTDANFVAQARPYLNEYVNTIGKNVGVYTLENPSDELPLFKITISLARDDAKENATETPLTDTDLLAVNITLENKLGTLKTSSAKDLSISYGNVVRKAFKGRVNPNTMEITIPESEKRHVNVSDGFDGLFGNIKTMHIENNKLHIKTPSKTYTMVHSGAVTPSSLQFPDGKYSIQQLMQAEKAPNALFLPVGSIIEFKTNKSRPIRESDSRKEGDTSIDRFAVYSIKGTLKHPASLTPRTLTGFFNAENETVSFTYSYPLPSNGTLDAVVRCQVAGTALRCAGHNKQWERKKYNDISLGVAIEQPKSPKGITNRSNRPAPNTYNGSGNKNRTPNTQTKTEESDGNQTSNVYTTTEEMRLGSIKLGNGWIF